MKILESVSPDDFNEIQEVSRYLHNSLDNCPVQDVNIIINTMLNMSFNILFESGITSQEFKEALDHFFVRYKERERLEKSS